MAKENDPPYSPQKRWAMRQKRKGCCTRCGEKRESYTSLCDRCQERRSLYMRKYRQALMEAKLAKQKVLKGNRKEPLHESALPAEAQ